MNSLRVEVRKIESSVPLSIDIANQLAERLPLGQSVIVAKRPRLLLAPIRKRWAALLRQQEKQRSSSLDAAKILELTKNIARLQTANFSLSPIAEDMWADVIINTPENLLECTPGCTSMYVATPLDKEVLYKITSFMPQDGLVVIYEV